MRGLPRSTVITFAADHLIPILECPVARRGFFAIGWGKEIVRDSVLFGAEHCPWRESGRFLNLGRGRASSGRGGVA
jgi:hypothetical protein